ncbi:---NA--- [Lecanosticta acicola]|uniref:---NA n=1 Tax=Lecanosticta acicola TaxID=111012 RepID=A0AAI8Z426_9PEZI|nr:---NA--- [Lecanosticta acicola]
MAALAAFRADDKIVRIITDHGHGSSCYVHRNLLVKSCEYLDAAIADENDPFDDGPIIIQTEVTQSAMGCFSHFLYTGQLKAAFKSISEILEVYKWTTHHLHCGDFRDALTDEAIKLLTNGLSPTAAPDIVFAVLNDYEDIDGGLSLLLIDWLVRSPFVCPYYAEINARLANTEATNPIHRALGQAFFEVKSIQDGISATPWLENPCQYHEHLPASSCVAWAPVTPQGPESSSPPPPPKTPQKRTLRRKTRSSTFDRDLDDMALDDDEDEDGVFETPSKSACPTTFEPWTNEERIHFLDLLPKTVDMSWPKMAHEHNKTFWGNKVSTFSRSVGSLRAELSKHANTTERAKALEVLPEKVAELKREMEASKQNDSKLSAIGKDSDTVMGVDEGESWTNKETIHLLRLFYENPNATDQQITDAHNGCYWAGNQERSAGDVTGKYLELIGVGRKVSTMSRIPATIAELKDGV